MSNASEASEEVENNSFFVNVFRNTSCFCMTFILSRSLTQFFNNNFTISRKMQNKKKTNLFWSSTLIKSLSVTHCQLPAMMLKCFVSINFIIFMRFCYTTKIFLKSDFFLFIKWNFCIFFLQQKDINSLVVWPYLNFFVLSLSPSLFLS